MTKPGSGFGKAIGSMACRGYGGFGWDLGAFDQVHLGMGEFRARDRVALRLLQGMEGLG
jgi:hypothetical protein